MPGTTYQSALYRARSYAGAPASVTPPLELPLYVLSRVVPPGPGCCTSALVVGNIVTLEASFYCAGVLVDPASLAVLIKDPSGDVLRYDFGEDAQPVQTAVGRYYLCQYLGEGGEYFYRWYAGAGAAEGSFEVSESVFA